MTTEREPLVPAGRYAAAGPATAAAAAAAALFVGMFLLTALPRVSYPYDLDFIEDGMVIQAQRLAEGLPVYAAPSVDFMPNVYMPLYPWLGGLLMRATGPGLAPLRWLTLASTLATAALLCLIARRESAQAGGSLPWPLLCAGLYLGGQRIVGFWFDLGRVDSLFVFLSLLGLTLGLHAGRSGARMAAAAVALALAFFTKQTGLAFGACVAGYLLATVGWRAWIFAAVWLGLVGMGLAWLNHITHGWFFFHVFHIAGSDPVDVSRIYHYLGFELFGPMAGLSVMAVAAALVGWRRWGIGFLRSDRWLWAIGAAAIVSGTGRASVGGNLNNLMPVYALLCLAPVLLWKAHRRSGSPGPLLPTVVLPVLMLAQFVLGVYNPLRYIPTPAMRASGDQLIARIRAIEGPVYVMMHPYYALLAGKEPSAQVSLLWHLTAWSGTPIPPDFYERIDRRYYAAILSDNSLFETDSRVQSAIDRNYVRAEALAGPPTTSGIVVQPAVLYLPR